MGLIDAILKPDDLPHDYDKWKDMPFPEQAKLACICWVDQFLRPLNL